MSRDKEPLIVAPISSSSSSSSSDDGGLITRGRRERLNMPRATFSRVRDQIKADRKFAEMILLRERVGEPSPIEVPGDAEYAQRLHEEINEAAQSTGEQYGDEVVPEGEDNQPATSSDDELWEINTTNEPVLTDEEIAEIRERYGIPSFVGMEANPLDHTRSHPPKGCIGMFASVLAAGFRVPMDEYEREILNTLKLAPIQLTPNSWRWVLGLRAAFKEQGFGEPSIDLLQVLFDVHANRPPRKKAADGTWISSWEGLTGFYYLSPKPKPRHGLALPGEGDLLTGKPSNVKGWKDKYFLFTSNWLRREDPVRREEFSVPYRKFRKFTKGWSLFP